MWQSLMIFATILIASFVQTTTGFAFAIIIMSVWPLFFPVIEATQLMMFGSAVCIITMAIRYRRHINLRIVWLPLFLGLCGTFAGTTALVNMANDTAVRIFGVALVFLAVYLIFFSDRVRVPSNLWTATIAGVASGLLGGFLTMPGPPMVLYYSVATRSKEEYLGTIQLLFAVMVVFRIILMWIQEGLSEFVVLNTPIAVVASVAGMLLGILLLDSIATRTLRTAVYVLMTAAGIWYIVR